MNSDNGEQGSVGPNTYLVLLALQALGIPLSLMVATPEKLIRSDGTKPEMDVGQKTFKGEVFAFGKLFKRKEVLLLIPFFITFQWAGAYQVCFFLLGNVFISLT